LNFQSLVADGVLKQTLLKADFSVSQEPWYLYRIIKKLMDWINLLCWEWGREFDEEVDLECAGWIRF